MKKKTVRKNTRKKINPLVIKAIGLIVVLLLAAAAALLISYWEEEDEEEIIKVNRYEGEEKKYVLESDKLLFELDSQTSHFTVTMKENGQVWHSNPPDAEQDALALTTEKNKLRSTMILTYSNVNGVDSILDNYAYSIEHQIYQIEEGDDYIKVYYSIGNVEKEFVIPAVIEEDRMRAVLEQLDNNDRMIIMDYYKKYDLSNLGKKDNKEELLGRYPILEQGPIYALRDTTKENMKKKMEGIFASVGYSYEEYLEDKEKDTAIKSSDKPVFNINVIYRLKGNELLVEVPFDEIEYKKEYPIYNLCLLPYFGAAGTADEGFLLVPEGGGALINFNNGKLAQSSYYADMYGWDMALDRDAIVHETGTSFNVFGEAKGDSSFICILDEGAAYASISADISGRGNSYNYVNAVYSMVHREKYDISNKYNGNMYVYEPGLPEGERIVQRYRFAPSADYVDMAAEYREYLLEKYGEAFTKKDDSQTPVVIEIIGAVDKIDHVLGIPVSKPLELTTFREAADIVAWLHGEGLENMSVKLTGWMNGGVQQKILKSVRLVKELGSKKDLLELINQSYKLGADIYLDGVTSYAYDSNIFNGFLVFRDAAKLVSKKRVELYEYSTVTYGKRYDLPSYYLLKPRVIQEMADNLAQTAAHYAAGVSFRDLGDELSSDFNRKEPVSRQQAMQRQISLLKKIKEGGTPVMVNSGNDYILPYCSIVTNMELEGASYGIIDRAVPFYQLAIHGYVNYSGKALNLAGNEKQELLKSAEYGAGLAFTLMDESAFVLQNTLYSRYFGAEYSSWRERLVELYTRYNRELGHVFGQEMVDHEYLDGKLTCTSYKDGTRVYVNYAYEDKLTDEGRIIPARDYLVVR